MENALSTVKKFTVTLPSFKLITPKAAITKVPTLATNDKNR
jgi:hypothetical protein